jgi:hypothetical protein
MVLCEPLSFGDLLINWVLVSMSNLVNYVAFDKCVLSIGLVFM